MRDGNAAGEINLCVSWGRAPLRFRAGQTPVLSSNHQSGAALGSENESCSFMLSSLACSWQWKYLFGADFPSLVLFLVDFDTEFCLRPSSSLAEQEPGGAGAPSSSHQGLGCFLSLLCIQSRAELDRAGERAGEFAVFQALARK